MSDKGFDRLNELDRLLRKAKPVEGFCPDHVQVTIEKVCGFELFNTRPYHNYETWSDGYRISDGEVRVQAEDLDDAVRLYAEVVAMAPEHRPRWQTMKPEVADLGWHVISGEGLLAMLRRVAGGEDPDMVYAEEYVNADREHVPGEDDA